MIIPPEVRQKWLPLKQASQFRPITEGLSSSQVWRVQLPDRALCLKASPRTAITQPRLTELHQFQIELSASLSIISKIERTSEGATFGTTQNHYWELSSWLPGSPMVASHVTEEQGQAAMQAVAQMHTISRSWNYAVGCSPAVTQRIDILQRYQARQAELKRVGDCADDPLKTLASQTLWHFQTSAARLETELTRLTAPTEQFWVLRDLHIEHVLFEDATVSGVIDFGAARIDEPLIDVVRLLGSFWPMDRKLRHEMLLAYLQLTRDVDFESATRLQLLGQQSKSQQTQLERYQFLDQASTLLSAMQWLQWLVVERRQFTTSTVTLINRWQMLVDRLDLNQW